MLDFFSATLDTVIALGTFFVNTITSLVNFILNLPTYTAFLYQSLNAIPTVLIPFAVLSVSLYVILFIINRR